MVCLKLVWCWAIERNSILTFTTVGTSDSVAPRQKTALGLDSHEPNQILWTGIQKTNKNLWVPRFIYLARRMESTNYWERLNKNVFKSSISGLKRHTCSILTSQVNSPKHFFPDTLKQDTREKCVGVCCRVIQPQDFVARKGFVDFVQHLVNVAAKLGK